MYNEEQKEKFIEFATNADSLERALRGMFNRTAKFEEEYGHDLCEMSVDEMQRVIDEVFGVATVSKRSRISNIREYVRWCRVQGIKGVTDAIDHTNIAGIDKFRRQMTASPMHLQLCLNAAYTPESKCTVDNIYRGYLWLGFMGFPESEIGKLKKNNLDFSEMKMHYEGKAYPIYAESVPTLRNCADLTEFKYYHESPAYETTRNRYASNGLLRGIKGDFNVLTMRAKVQKKIRDLASQGTVVYQLSYKRLSTSGLFYRIYTAERAGAINSPKHSLIDYFLEREILQTSAETMAREYMIDYERWKLAFGI